MLTSLSFKKRFSKLEGLMDEENIDLSIILQATNIYYLTGFPRGRALIVSSSSAPILIVPELEYEEAKSIFKLGEIVSLKRRGELANLILQCIRRIEIKGKIALELSAIPYNSYLNFKGKISKELVDCSNLVRKLRMVKDEEEINLIQKSLRIAEKGVEAAFQNLNEGISEIELAGEAEYAMRKAGAEAFSFETLVASGTRSAYPHGTPTSKPLHKNETVIIDLGAKYCGYCSDITRSGVVGNGIQGKFKEIFDCIVEAISIAVDEICEGIPASNIDMAARKIIEHYGYGKYFNHGLGHGVGLSVHEAPSLSSQSGDILEKGNVVTVEPGIYIPGFGGVRIEEMVLVTSSGCKVLNSIPRILQ
ncbi:MAG: Xaa-Pro peptidase family protein [archaeon GB-1845-036]|nr:Xaa-Pro peptidase family protein [Candidatus Culexmicrobium thermophilum]HDO20610.1 aminopeptidase P family protein [Candidatus Bathyarchaeota archaeon]